MGWVQAGQLGVAWSRVIDKPETATRWPNITEVGGVSPKPARVASGFLRDDGMWTNGYHNSLILYADNPAGGGRYIRVGILSNTSRKVPDGNMYIDFFSANSAAPADPQLRLIRWAGANGIGELVHRGNGQMRLWALGDAQIHFGSGGISRMYYDPATQGWSIPASGGLRIGGHVTHHDGNDARLITSDNDPGAVGAGAVWVRTSHPMGLHVRNGDNSGWIRIGGGMQVQKQQVFTNSGTFTPPPGMIAQGGHCEVLLVGGGEGANGSHGFNPSVGTQPGQAPLEGRGGDGGAVRQMRLAGITTPQQVIIGAGGAASATVTTAPKYKVTITGLPGGNSQFGQHIASGGGTDAYMPEGVAKRLGARQLRSPDEYIPPTPPVGNYGGGGSADDVTFLPQRENTGAGGNLATANTYSVSSTCKGRSGICIVTWWEAV